MGAHLLVTRKQEMARTRPRLRLSPPTLSDIAPIELRELRAPRYGWSIPGPTATAEHSTNPLRSVLQRSEIK